MQLREAKKVLVQHKKELARMGVRSLALFGSFARGEAKRKSDIDVLVDFDARKGLFMFMDVKDYLEELLHREVDLVSRRALHPALKERILREAKDVF